MKQVKFYFIFHRKVSDSSCSGGGRGRMYTGLGDGSTERYGVGEGGGSTGQDSHFIFKGILSPCSRNDILYLNCW